MNELDLIRGQLRTERERVGEVARACASAGATEGLRQAGVEYLVFVLTRFDERDQRLAEHASAQPPALQPEDDVSPVPSPDQILSRAGSSREALARLAAATDSAGEAKADRWRAFAEFCDGPWRLRRDAIDAFQQKHLRIADWRAVSFVDADSILEERARHARVQAKLPRTTSV